MRPVLAAYSAPRAPLALPAYRAAPGPVRAAYAGVVDAPLGAARPAEPRRGRWQKVAAVVAAAVCGWTVYADPIARERAAHVLAAFLPPPPSVAFEGLEARRGEMDGQTILYIEGIERNATKHAIKAGTVRVALLGEDGQPLYSWTAKPSGAEIAPQGATSFRARLLSPPAFRSIAVSLADGKP